MMRFFTDPNSSKTVCKSTAIYKLVTGTARQRQMFEGDTYSTFVPYTAKKKIPQLFGAFLTD